jgi:lysozyme
MRMSAEGLERLMQWEGFKSHAYRDVADLWTIGVGHLMSDEEKETDTIYINAAPVDISKGLGSDLVFALLAQDIIPREDAVTELVKVELNQNQFDALVSFVFNVGEHAFAKSTMLRLLNMGDYGSVPGQLMRWNKAGGKVVKGLNTRRSGEVAMWLSLL